MILMEFKITDKKEEPLLSRTRVEAEVSFDKATPSKSDIKKALVKELGKDEKLIVVKKVFTGYGVRKAKSVSYAYENEKAMSAIELKAKEKEGAANKEAEEAPKAEEKKEVKKGGIKDAKEGKEEKTKEEKVEQPKESQKEAKQQEKPKEQKATEEKKQ